jgi:hypothetical protein
MFLNIGGADQMGSTEPGSRLAPLRTGRNSEHYILIIRDKKFGVFCEDSARLALHVDVFPGIHRSI